MLVAPPEQQALHHLKLHLGCGVSLGGVGRKVHTIDSTAPRQFAKNMTPRLLRDRGEPLRGIGPKYRRAKARRDAHDAEVDLLILAFDERPNRRGEFGAARRNHESYRAIDLSGFVPALNERHHCC